MKKKKNHKKESFWQIWIPLTISVLIVIAVAVFVVLSTTRDLSGNFNVKWSSISLVYLSLPALFGSLIFFILLCLIIYLIAKIYTLLPIYSQKALEFLNITAKNARLGSDKITKPLILLNSKVTGIAAIFDRKKEEI